MVSQDHGQDCIGFLSTSWPDIASLLRTDVVAAAPLAVGLPGCLQRHRRVGRDGLAHVRAHSRLHVSENLMLCTADGGWSLVAEELSAAFTAVARVGGSTTPLLSCTDEYCYASSCMGQAFGSDKARPTRTLPLVRSCSQSQTRFCAVSPWSLFLCPL